MQKKTDLHSIRHSLASVSMGLQCANSLTSNLETTEKTSAVKNIVRLCSERVDQILAQIDKENGLYRNANDDADINGLTPASLEPTRVPLGVILIDDCPMVRQTWKLFYKKRGIPAHLFASPQEFDSVAETFDKNTHLYIDLELGNGMNGLDVSKTYFEMGFKNIYLATGHQRIDDQPAFLAGVVGKAPVNLVAPQTSGL